MNDGFLNEKELKYYIQKNNFENYTENIQNFLRFAFKDNLNTSLKFESEKIEGQVKPDIYIKHNGITKYISVKKGTGNSVHQEKITDFFPYIHNILGIEFENHFKKFHYGDDTLNDTGSIRYNASECKLRYNNEIIILNNKINQWEYLNDFLERFLFLGNVGNLSIDYIYHGNIEYGLWASKHEIISFVKNNIFFINGIHFGPLTYQVWGRNEKKTSKNPNRRYVMQIKWGSLKKDLSTIRGKNYV